MTDSPLEPNGSHSTVRMSGWRNVSLRQIALGTMIIVGMFLAFWLIIALRYVFVLLFLGIVVATALIPAMEWFRERGVPRTVAALIIYTALLAASGTIISLLLPSFTSQMEQALQELPTRYSEVRETLLAFPFMEGVVAQMPADPFVLAFDNNNFGLLVTTWVPSFWQSFVLILLIGLLSYYWLYYRTLTIQSLAMLFPLNWRAEALNIWNSIETQIGAFVRGLAILCFTIASLSAVGYTLIGLPFALPLALIAGLLEVIPYVGPFLALLLAGLVGLSVSPSMALQAIAIALVIQFLESTIVVPRVMDRAVGVRPVVTLLALAIFSEIFGLLGALLAVPLAAVLQILLGRFVLKDPDVANLEIGGRGQLALLRYHAQELVQDMRQRIRVKSEEPTAKQDSPEEELEMIIRELDVHLARAQEQPQ